MKYNVRLSATGSGNWFVESDSDGHWGAFVAFVCSETLARQIASMLESGALRESLHVQQTPDTGLGAVIGKWPGTETDEEVAELLRRHNMNWEHDEFLYIYTARSGEVILEVVLDYGHWYFDVALATGVRIVSPALYDTADAAKSAAEHALAIWRKGESA